MEARGRRLSWWMGGIAAAGVLLTHWLTYLVAVPHAHQRADLLHHVGHGHLPVVSAVAVALFTAASLRLGALGLRGGQVSGFRSTAAHLAAWQAVAWIALEVGERAAGGRLATIDDHAVLLIGLGVQAAVALLGAALVCLTVGALLAFARPGSRLRPRPKSARLPAGPSRPHRLVPLTGAHALRGPPRLSPTS